MLTAIFDLEKEAQSTADKLRDQGYRKVYIEKMAPYPPRGVDQMNNPYSGDFPSYARGLLGSNMAATGTSEKNIYADFANTGSGQNNQDHDNKDIKKETTEEDDVHEAYRLKIFVPPANVEEVKQLIREYNGDI